MYAEIYLKGVAQPVYQHSISSTGTFNWRWVGFNTGTNPAVNAPIDYIDIIPILQQSSGTAYFDDITVNEYAPSSGAVTLMFDDGETGTYTEAKKLLSRYGYIGSSAVISDQIGETGFMTQEQVLGLQTDNWEIVSHSVNHEDMTAMTPTQYTNELVNSKSALEAFLGAGKVKDFAYPLGAYNADIIAAAAAAGYQSTRAYEIGDNPMGAFPYDVKVQSVVESTTITDVQSWLTAAKNNGRWTMIVMHTVTERAGDDTYYVSPAQLNHILDAVRDSGLSVLTYDQAVQTYGVSK
jgi:peptidoglycan/xylan/chitin deacetylase (PgdA/CDA1 family)